jgi:hypothetical protein
LTGAGLHRFLQDREHRGVVLAAARAEPDQRRRPLLSGRHLVGQVLTDSQFAMDPHAHTFYIYMSMSTKFICPCTLHLHVHAH